MSFPRKMKRPVTFKTLAQHLAEVLTGIDVQTILDVGYGELRRSTLALAKIFPEAQIDAIDNDLHLVNRIVSSEPDLGQVKVRYLFGDAECWLPKQKYDLVVVCHSVHAFHHPLRAVANLVEHNLKREGYLLFVHRTDAVMRAIGRMYFEEKNIPDAQRIMELWDLTPPVSLPWRTRLVHEHDALQYLCHCLGFERAKASICKSYPREETEYLSDVFGTRDQPPQYQAPLVAWIEKREVWPSYDGSHGLTSEVEITSHLYQLPRGPVLFHDFAPAATSTPTEIVKLCLHSDEKLESEEFKRRIWELLPGKLGGSEPGQGDVLGAYYIDQHDNVTVWGPRSEIRGHPANMMTSAIIKSPAISRPGHRGQTFLFLFLPAVKQASAFEFNGVVPVRLKNTLGLSGLERCVIPMFEKGDRALLKNLLEKIGFAEGELDHLSEYLMTRGQWVLDQDAAAIYYFFFGSEILAPSDIQAVGYLTRNWLDPDSVRRLADVACAILSGLEERRAHQAVKAEDRARIFQIIQEPVERISQEVARLEVDARRIRDILLPVQSTLFLSLQSACDFFDPTRRDTIPLGRQRVKVSHIAPTDIEHLRQFVSAVILKVLGRDDLVGEGQDLVKLADWVLVGPDLEKVSPLQALSVGLGLWDGSSASPKRLAQLNSRWLESIFLILKGLCHSLFKPEERRFDASIFRILNSKPFSSEPIAQEITLAPEHVDDLPSFINSVQRFLVPEGSLPPEARLEIDFESGILALTRSNAPSLPNLNWSKLQRRLLVAGGSASTEPDDEDKTALWEWVTQPMRTVFPATGLTAVGDLTGYLLMIFGRSASRVEVMNPSCGLTVPNFASVAIDGSNRSVTLQTTSAQR